MTTTAGVAFVTSCHLVGHDISAIHTQIPVSLLFADVMPALAATEAEVRSTSTKPS